MMLNSKWLFGILALVLIETSQAAPDDFDSWKKSQEQGVAKIQDDYRKYKDENDRLFADFLKAQWKEFDVAKGVMRDPKPKPRILPTAKPQPVEKPLRITPSITLPPTVIPPPLPTLLPVVTPRPSQENVVKLNFYGNVILVPYVSQWRQRQVSGGLSAENMSAFWGAIGSSNFEPALAQLQIARKTLKLDDWGYLTLTRSYVEALQPSSVTDQNLLLWFFMIKSGYDVRCAYMGADLYVFVAVSQKVYGTKYLQVQNIPYYAVLAADRGENMKTFYTYDAKYPGNLRPVDLRVRSLAFTQAKAESRELRWSYGGRSFGIEVPYDRQAIEFLKSYPQADIRVPFSADLSPLSRGALLRELRPLLAGMSEDQAVNFLLGFVQKAFEYKTDEDQFGYEKYFFGEEILFYPYSDCEDRSVFFAWLVHELLGLDVIGLSYPGHIATAVRLHVANPRGDSVLYNGNRYVVTDPTYIGASYGMTQPAYARTQPTVISW